jgi:prepilin-type N-terminal cleavage/methylation domain-containing protein
MPHTKHITTKGFTFVEILIVVVIISLLAAMAIPAFQTVRTNAVISTMDNDARQVSSAAQQFFMESGDDSVNADALGTYYDGLSKGVELNEDSLNMNDDFTLAHDQVDEDRLYNSTGKFQGDAEEAEE